MVRVLMHGCCGAMGRVITGLAADREDLKIVAGVDRNTDDSLGYPVFQSLEACDVEVDAIIDFTAAPAVDHLLDYCAEKKVPVVLCSTGLSDAQMAKVSESAKKVAVLRSANMSLGINLLMKLVKDAAATLADAGVDIEIVEKHHNRWKTAIIIPMIAAPVMRRETRRRLVFLQSAAVPSWESMT